MVDQLIMENFRDANSRGLTNNTDNKMDKKVGKGRVMLKDTPKQLSQATYDSRLALSLTLH